MLLLFPFSLEGEARIWLDKEPPRSILTWEDLVSKFINQFFPPSKTTYLRSEITNFLQKPNDTFNEAWERFKDLLRQYEQWFDLTKDTLRDALLITPVKNNNAFSSPPTPDALIHFRALTTIINLCFMGKTLGFERLWAPVMQIVWGIVNRARIDYAERIWEEFTQSIHTFIEDKNNLTQHTQGKKKATLIVIPSVRFTKMIIYYLQSKHKFYMRPDSPLHLPNEEPGLGYLKFSAKGTKREVFGMPIQNELITANIQGKQHYKEYLEKVAKHQRYLVGEEGSDPDSLAPKPVKATKKPKPSAPKVDLRPPVIKPASSQQPKPKPAPANSLRSVDESVDKGIPKKEPRFDDEEDDIHRAVEESLKSVHDAPRGPLPPMVIRELDSGKFQPVPEVCRKGKEKRRTPASTEPSGHAKSPSIYASLGLTESDSESDEEVPLVVKVEAQDEGQAGANPGVVTKGQARSDPGDDENLKLTVEEHVILEEPASSIRTLSSLQHLAKDFSFGNQFFNDKPSEAENKKKTAKTKAESMVSVTIQQDMSAIPYMTTPAIQDPLWNRFKDLPEADMKEILHQRMWETNSYKAHEDHMMLYEALKKSMNYDHTDELLKDLAEARRKKKKRHDSPKTSPGSPPHQPPQ
uniref:Reverse transcriptase domain-containing protein n=1 Tax=Tanacetum cinerariifolium TaxID=118510 RepID=A0A6L2LNP8_TANCI|nr:reverse transcriptase domain-containing protein [Tanacetum cinerariifolium]